MTVFEYFDYEKQLLADLKLVKTDRAKDAVYSVIEQVLSEHYNAVIGIIKKLEKDIQTSNNIAQTYLRGETPDYVKNLMAEFGFHELEDCDSYGGDIGFGGTDNLSHMKKDIRYKLKSLCKSENDLIDTEMTNLSAVVPDQAEIFDNKQTVITDVSDKKKKKPGSNRKKREKRKVSGGGNSVKAESK